MNAKHPHPHPPWIPRRGLHIRWDRTLTLGDAMFRWHSRLDGAAILHGPSGRLTVGDAVPMPVGHMHGKGAVTPAVYVVTRIHDEGDGHAWIEAVRRSE